MISGIIQNYKKLFILFSVFSLILLFSGSIIAVKMMNAVPQEIGFKDFQFSDLTRPLCEDCHGDSLADAHHGTKKAIAGDCASCHAVSTKGNIGVTVTRDCMKCHKKSPHHKTEAALNKECTSCHDSPGVGDYTLKVPSYKPSLVTPTKNSCKNCHLDGVVDGVKVVGIKKAHHGISLKGCDICHDPKNKSSDDIRICERCHNVKAIHEVIPHIKKENCAGCHSDKINAKKEEAKKEEVKK